MNSQALLRMLVLSPPQMTSGIGRRSTKELMKIDTGLGGRMSQPGLVQDSGQTLELLTQTCVAQCS